MAIDHHQSPKELVIRVDKLRCAGSGVCAVIAPSELTLGADGHAMVLRPITEASDELFEAAEMCPTEAISVLLKEQTNS
jgi:ferredoxin